MEVMYKKTKFIIVLVCLTRIIFINAASISFIFVDEVISTNLLINTVPLEKFC